MFYKGFFCCITVVFLLLSGCAPVKTVPSTKCIPSSQIYKKGTGIAIWDFEIETPTGSLPDSGSLLSDKIIQHLFKEKHFRVFSRDQLLHELETLKWSSSDLANETTRLQLGKIVGAKLMVFGLLSQYPLNMMNINLRLVDVETGKTIKVVQKFYQSSSLEISDWEKAVEEMTPELFQICP